MPVGIVKSSLVMKIEVIWEEMIDNRIQMCYYRSSIRREG